MNEAMTRLFESVDSGFLWIDKDAKIRYLNARAAAMTGFQLGHDVAEGVLQRTVRAVLQGMSPQPVQLPSPTGKGRTLTYSVMRGLMRDDAVVFVTSDAPGPVDVGLDNLLAVVRTDLAEPAKRLASTLERAGDNPPDARQFVVLAEDMKQVSVTLGKIVDLGQLWGSSSLLANDRIDMWEMLLDVWKHVEPIAVSRKQSVRFSRYPADEPLATVYGSSLWLRRVFKECLEAELRKAAVGATIDIEYRQMGTRVLVAFRDNGLFPPRRDGAEALNAPPATSAGRGAPPAPPPPPKPAARDLIGLRLCQDIVALHGGCLREEEEDDMPVFLIDLPTGAPAHFDHAEIDMQQAQRYALDIAELMARRRKRA